MMKSFLVALTVLKELCMGPGGSANRTSRYFLWVLFLSFLVFLGWASVSQFEQVISSEARIIPDSKLQTIQHLEGGLIQSIHVAAGQTVKQGDELITLSPLESVGGLETKKIRAHAIARPGAPARIGAPRQAACFPQRPGEIFSRSGRQ